MNRVAKFDAYPMPRVEEVFEGMGTASVVSILDLAKGYWQIPLTPESREKTAFTTPFGLFEFEVMPFSLHNAAATFQRTMNHVLRRCQEFTQAYIDDIGVFSHNWQEHLRHFQEVFDQIQQAGLTVKLKKCRFGQDNTRYLGHVIGDGEVQPDPEKVRSVQNYPKPKTKKDVRSFLGLAGYYRRFIPGFTTVAAPLTQLTKMGQPSLVNVDQPCQKAFTHLKEVLMTRPVLQVADPGKPFLLQTDASDYGLGAVLSQEDAKDEEHPVAFASRKLFPREMNYSVIEKECLAIVWALTYFNVYLEGQPVTVQTNHKPLAWLQKMKNANGHLTRWALVVQSYRIMMSHQKGCDNGNADRLL